MKSHERWNKRIPPMRRLSKTRAALALRLINLNRQLRNLDKFGPLAKSLKAPGAVWRAHQQKIVEVRREMYQVQKQFFFY